MSTQAEKIAILTANIRRAEDRAARELEAGNDFGHRSNLDYADECRAELKRVKSEA